MADLEKWAAEQVHERVPVLISLPRPKLLAKRRAPLADVAPLDPPVALVRPLPATLPAPAAAALIAAAVSAVSQMEAPASQATMRAHVDRLFPALVPYRRPFRVSPEAIRALNDGEFLALLGTVDADRISRNVPPP